MKKLEELKSQLLFHKGKINEIEIEINRIEGKTEIDTNDLIKRLSDIKHLANIDFNGFVIRYEIKGYEFILGGDGRSQPWSEIRKGYVCEVETPFFLTASQIGLIKVYLKELGEINHLIVDGEKI